jgi:hypothetical protein
VSLDRPRRFYLLKRIEAARRLDDALASAWQAKQEAEPGVVLAATFPYRTRLAAAGYTTTEDVSGATTEELKLSGFSESEAAAVLAAL